MTYEVMFTDASNVGNGAKLNLLVSYYGLVWRAEFTGTGRETSRQLALRARRALENRYSIRMPSLRKKHDCGDSILYNCKDHKGRNLCVIVEAMHG